MRRLIVIAARGLVVSPSPPRSRKPAPLSIFLRKGVGTGIILPRGFTPPSRSPPPEWEGNANVSDSPSPLREGVRGGGNLAFPRPISFRLFDPLKRPFRRPHRTPVCEPRISYAGPFATLSPVKVRFSPAPDDPLDATRLSLRLQALAAALDDLPKQAHRLAHWQANRDAASREGQFTFFPPECAVASMPAQAEKSKLSPALPRRFRRLSPLRPGRPPGFSRRLDADMRDMLTDLHGLAHDALEQPDTS